MPNDRVALGVVLLDHGNLRLKLCRPGFVMFNPKDRFIGRSFDLYGEFSELEAQLFRQIVKPGMVVLDVGANIGAHTLDFARSVGPGGLVIAIEPQRVLYQMLCGNLALNRIAHVRALNAGAGRAVGRAGVPRLDYSGENNFGGVSLVREGESEPVDIIAIDGLELAACHFVKVDVEGMESEVLAGAALTIKRHRPYLYVENDRRDRSAALIEQIRAMGYRLYWHFPPLFNPGNFYANPHNVFGSIGSLNMLCVPLENAKTIEGGREVAGPQDWPLASP
jgi:FkbM family methyltransferase